MEPKLIDRGVDCILKTDDKIVRVDKLSTTQLIQLLNEYGLTKIETVSFSEYGKSEIYDSSLI